MKDKPLILIVEDDPDIGPMIKILLEFNGYSVLLSDGVEKAEIFLKDTTPDLIVMDMLLAGFNGAELCMHLKQSAGPGNIPILMISAYPNARKLCLDAGANDFVAKPFDMDVMLSSVHRLLQN